MKQQKLNKDRAKRMERELAKALDGDRTPMSGAGSQKGDVKLRNTPLGNIYVEAKYSAMRDKNNRPYITLQAIWFRDMIANAIKMKDNLAILIVQFHRRGKYVFLPLKDGEKDTSWKVKRVFEENILGLHKTPHGEYECITLEVFKKLVLHQSEE